jgi:hypothetical protein
LFPRGISDNACAVKSKDIWRSVLLARINTTNQDIQMPHFRNLIDTNGVQVITDWINSLPGTPALAFRKLSQRKRRAVQSRGGVLALALEAGRDGVAAVRFPAKTHFGKLGIADREVARDKRHLDGFLPFAEMSKSPGGRTESAIRDGAKFDRGSSDCRK